MLVSKVKNWTIFKGLYRILAEMPDVGRRILETLKKFRIIKKIDLKKNVIPFGLAVWPAIANIFTSGELNYICR